MKTMTQFFFITFLFLTLPVEAKVALVKLLKGDVQVQHEGKERVLKLDDWVDEGMIIKTGEKSFIKLLFVDKSSMNIGPKSEMKIEKFNGKEASVFDVVKGQIRSQVTKDYLQNKDTDKSKLFIKTSNTVMGVRGTDFMITTNGTNTSTVLFEGEIVFNSLPADPQARSHGSLENVVNQGVKIRPGEFSVVQGDLPQPTVPSTLNLKQREALEKNVNLESQDRSPSSTNSSAHSPKSIVPEGLSGETVSNSSEILKNEVTKNSSVSPVASAPLPTPTPAANAAGFVSGDTVKPANGSFVHFDSGTIIPPPAGSVLDTNTNTFIPAPGNGSVASDGSFVPPEGVEITGEGKILVTVNSAAGAGAGKVIEVAKIPPVVVQSSSNLRTVVEVINNTPTLQTTTTPVQVAQVVSSTVAVPQTPVAPTVIYTPPSQTNYTTATPTETQIINQATSGRLNINVIDR